MTRRRSHTCLLRWWNSAPWVKCRSTVPYARTTCYSLWWSLVSFILVYYQVISSVLRCQEKNPTPLYSLVRRWIYQDSSAQMRKRASFELFLSQIYIASIEVAFVEYGLDLRLETSFLGCATSWMDVGVCRQRRCTAMAQTCKNGGLACTHDIDREKESLNFLRRYDR